MKMRERSISARKLPGFTVFWLVLLLLSIGVSDAQAERWREVFTGDPAARRVFESALQDFRNGDFSRAEIKFRDLQTATRHFDAEVASLFLAKCLLANQQYDDADVLLTDCRREFTGGRYEDMFYYLSGHAAYYRADPERAARFYLDAYRISEDEVLKERVIQSLTPLFSRWLEDAAFRRLAALDLTGPPAAELYFYWAGRLENRGRMTQAARYYDESLRHDRRGQWAAAAKERLEYLRNYQKKKITLGLLYPAEGPLAEFGEKMSRAARLAAEYYQSSGGGFLEILSEDTQGDPLQASIAVRHLLDEGVQAVVGPLTSECAVATANILACVELPQVLPAASQAGLTSLSDHLYQLNTPPPLVGETIASFAIDSLGDSIFAALVPDEPYGHEIASAFQRTAVQKGALVLPVQYCDPGQTDYRNELMRLKLIILREFYDSTVFFTADGDTLDEEEVPVQIGGFFIPGDAADINDIVPQVRFYNIFARYLGTDGWAQPERLSRANKYLEGAVFASAEYQPESTRRRDEFLAVWKKRYGGSPGLVAARTYDAVLLAVDLVKAGKDNGRPPLLNYEGASGTIDISANRENVFVPLYGHHQGRIIPANELPRPEPPPPDSTTVDSTLVGPRP